MYQILKGRNMVKKEGKKKASMPRSGYRQPSTLREEKNGKKEFKGVKTAQSMLRMQHLQNLAAWASGEAGVAPLAALFGQRLAATAEAMGVSVDPSLFSCQRCETILQPGQNCTIRIERNKSKRQHRRKVSLAPSQNNVVYTCHFCSYRNLKRGSSKGNMKALIASQPKPLSASAPLSSTDHKVAIIDEDRNTTGKIRPMLEPNCDNIKKSQAITNITIERSPVTPSSDAGIILPEVNRNNSMSGSSKTIKNNGGLITEKGNAASGSSKRKRKGWSSLKEITKSNELENARRITNLTIPFFL